MENLGVTELGIAGVLLLLLLDRLPTFVNRIRGTDISSADEVKRTIEIALAPLSDLHTLLGDMKGHIKDLHIMHSKTDVDGIPVWYLPTSFKKDVSELSASLERLATSQEAQAKALIEAVETNKATVTILERLNQKMPKNGGPAHV